MKTQAPQTQPQAASSCPAPMPTIRCRDDLSFTHRESAGHALANWTVPHDPVANWGDGVLNGRRLFAEVETLAAADELEAFYAILFALNSGTWRGSAGTEYGFSEALAALAIQGMRSLLAGADRFDIEAESFRRWEEEDQASRQGEESSAGQVIADAKGVCHD